MNTLSKPRTSADSGPSPDDDPTGVRDLLSALPEPDPMPAHLVERITASLATEQAQRAMSSSGASVIPLLGTRRRGPRQGSPTRLLLGVAGIAAAVVVLAVIGSNALTSLQHNQTTATSAVAGAPRISAAETGSAAKKDDRLKGAFSSPDQAPGAAHAPAPSVVQITLSDTRYTMAGFVTQVRTLRRAAFKATPATPSAAARGTTGELALGPAGTSYGLRACLVGLGVAGAQAVRADVAFYEGRPAVIIVATIHGVPTAYAVGRQCSSTDPAVLRPATPLP